MRLLLGRTNSHDIWSNPYSWLSTALGQLVPLTDSSQDTALIPCWMHFLGTLSWSWGDAQQDASELRFTSGSAPGPLRTSPWPGKEKNIIIKMNLPPSQSHSQLSSWWILNGTSHVPGAPRSGWPRSQACAPWGPSTQRWRRVFTESIAAAFLLHSSNSLGPMDQGPWSVWWPFSGHLIPVSVSKMTARSLAPWLARAMGGHSRDALPDTLLLSAGPGFGSQSRPVFPLALAVLEAPTNEEPKGFDWSLTCTLHKCQSRGLYVYICTEDCSAWSGRWVALVIQAWSLPAAVAEGLTQMGRNPPSLCGMARRFGKSHLEFCYVLNQGRGRCVKLRFQSR